MKRFLFFAFSVCLWGAMASLSAQTDLYNRYASRTDIRVASVTNFVLDTGITADVTVIEAIDDEGWKWMCNEFSLIALNDSQRQQLEQGWEVSMFAQRDRNDPTRPAPVVRENIDAGSSCYLGVSYLSQTLYIFCCTTQRESDVIIDYLISKMRKNR